jgi:hypothetical protein
MTPLEICVVEVVKRGLDDWVDAAEVAWVVKFTGDQTTDSGIESLALEVIARLLRRGLMKPGDVTKDGFCEWDLEPHEAVERITRSWKALGRLPGLGEVCWLSNTGEGDRKARESGAPSS